MLEKTFLLSQKIPIIKNRKNFIKLYKIKNKKKLIGAELQKYFFSLEKLNYKIWNLKEKRDFLKWFKAHLERDGTRDSKNRLVTSSVTATLYPWLIERYLLSSGVNSHCCSRLRSRRGRSSPRSTPFHVLFYSIRRTQ